MVEVIFFDVVNARILTGCTDHFLTGCTDHFLAVNEFFGCRYHRTHKFRVKQLTLSEYLPKVFMAIELT